MDLDVIPEPADALAPFPLRFVKGHGTQNDFVLVDDHDGQLDIRPERIRAICDRRAGIGADGLIRVVRTAAAGIDAPADAPEWFMDYRNADGSTAEMCGNGVRVFAAHLQRSGLITEVAFDIWTRAGARTVEIIASPEQLEGTWSVQVGMGRARVGEQGRTVRIGDLALEATAVDMGNPHAVAFLPERVRLDDLDLTRRPGLDPEPSDGSNIELVSPRGRRHVAMRVHERGVGETSSCGTGVAAVAVAAARRAGDTSEEPWIVDVPGGRLDVVLLADGQVILTGPAAIVAEGTALI